MLVLSRHRDESILIGDDIRITVVDIRGDKVRLGISAPLTIPVHREEVAEAIAAEQRRAAEKKTTVEQERQARADERRRLRTEARKLKGGL